MRDKARISDRFSAEISGFHPRGLQEGLDLVGKMFGVRSHGWR
jgi:hypothetical protein